VKEISAFLYHSILVTWLYVRTLASYLWVLYLIRVLEIDYPAEKLKKKHVKNAIRYKKVATKFRGGLIKLAQFISTQEKMLPPEIVEILKTLQDDVEPVPYQDVEETIVDELGALPEDIFDDFEKESIASASFGQVHKARLKTGEIVAIKVQHKSIERSLDIDLTMAGHFLKAMASLLSKPQILDMYEEIKKALYIELNYKVEAEFATKFRENFKDREDHLIPKIYEEFSTSKVIVMDYIDGYKITDLENIKTVNSTPEEILEVLIDSYFQQFYYDGFFHTDPHPGNLFYLKGENGVRISFIDFGQSKELEPEVQAGLKIATMGVLTSNVSMVVDSFVTMGIITDRERGKVTGIVSDVLSRVKEGSADAIMDLTMDFDFLRSKLSIIVHQLDIKFPEGVVLYGRTLAYLNGLIGTLSSSSDMFEIARRALIKRF